MREQAVKIFQFNELSDKAKEKAREWFREVSASDPIHEAIWEDAEQILAYMGFTNQEFEYTGFWRQGDGAHITGRWNNSLNGMEAKVGRLFLVKQHAPIDEELHRIAKEFDEIASAVDEHFTVTVTHRGNYSHENTMCFDFEYGGDDTSDFGIDVDDKFQEACRSFARWLYRQLEKEYEFQNSDETVDSNIEANEYEFTEDGKRWKM